MQILLTLSSAGLLLSPHMVPTYRMWASSHSSALQHVLARFTYHFPLGAEESVTLQGLVVLALDDVGEHFVVHLVRCAIGYSERKEWNTDARGLESFTLVGAPHSTLLSYTSNQTKAKRWPCIWTQHACRHDCAVCRSFLLPSNKLFNHYTSSVSTRSTTMAHAVKSLKKGTRIDGRGGEVISCAELRPCPREEGISDARSSQVQTADWN